MPSKAQLAARANFKKMIQNKRTKVGKKAAAKKGKKGK